MDIKSKFLFWFVFAAIAISIFATFYKTIVLQDFEVTEADITIETESYEI